jgi:hypothetical protein
MGKSLYPVLIYYHKGEAGPLDRLLGWWTHTATSLNLIVRSDEDDKHLPEVEELNRKYSKVPWSWVIGPPMKDIGYLVTEFWEEWPEHSHELVYATDKAADIAQFILTFESQDAKRARN